MTYYVLVVIELSSRKVQVGEAVGAIQRLAHLTRMKGSVAEKKLQQEWLRTGNTR